MKIDIEGSEVEVLPDLIYEKSLEKVDGIMVEYHEVITKEKKRKKATGELRKLVKSVIDFSNLVRTDGKLTEIVQLDDESYHATSLALPKCDQIN